MQRSILMIPGKLFVILARGVVAITGTNCAVIGPSYINEDLINNRISKKMCACVCAGGGVRVGVDVDVEVDMGVWVCVCVGMGMGMGTGAVSQIKN